MDHDNDNPLGGHFGKDVRAGPKLPPAPPAKDRKDVNWITSVVRPKIRGMWQKKRETPDNLWVKDPETGQMVYYKDLEANQFVMPGSNYHMRMAPRDRLISLFDNGDYDTIPVADVPLDPLKFRDEKKYTDRLKSAREETEQIDAVLLGEGRLDGVNVVAAAQDFRFMGGSLGMAAGEAVITGMLRAVETASPFIMFAASGGARMQEGVLSLMQMPRTTVAVQKLREARLPYLVVLTHPTTGGVTASYAMLGDVHIAEPGALIGFAGPRVIEQTIREQLPEGFQRSEYLLSHGMVDIVVHRHQLRDTLIRLVRVLTSGRATKLSTDDRAPLAITERPINGGTHAAGKSTIKADQKAAATARVNGKDHPAIGGKDQPDPADKSTPIKY